MNISRELKKRLKKFRRHFVAQTFRAAREAGIRGQFEIAAPTRAGGNVQIWEPSAKEWLEGNFSKKKGGKEESWWCA